MTMHSKDRKRRGQAIVKGAETEKDREREQERDQLRMTGCRKSAEIIEICVDQ